jgi:hypothetical protein
VCPRCTGERGEQVELVMSETLVAARSIAPERGSSSANRRR